MNLNVFVDTLLIKFLRALVDKFSYNSIFGYTPSKNIFGKFQQNFIDLIFMNLNVFVDNTIDKFFKSIGTQI